MKKLLSLLTIFAASCLTFAQDADKITKILETEKLTYAQAAYICVSAAEEIENEGAAYKNLIEKNVINEKYEPGDAITLRNFAHLCAKTWNVKGSLFLMLFKSPRYAFRQMRADGIIRTSADGSKKLSGRDALNIVSDCINVYESKGDAQ